MPRMRMYTVIFEQDGEMIATFTTHAAGEKGARAKCDAFFRDHPDHAFPLGARVSIRVEQTKLPSSDPGLPDKRNSSS